MAGARDDGKGGGSGLTVLLAGTRSLVSRLRREPGTPTCSGKRTSRSRRILTKGDRFSLGIDGIFAEVIPFCHQLFGVPTASGPANASTLSRIMNGRWDAVLVEVAEAKPELHWRVLRLRVECCYSLRRAEPAEMWLVPSLTCAVGRKPYETSTHRSVAACSIPSVIVRAPLSIVPSPILRAP